MLEIKGKYTSAKIFAETYEEDVISSVYDMCNSPAFEGVQIRMCPDAHQGKNCCIGATYPIGNFLNPNHIGVDIGCLLSVHKLSQPIKQEDYELIEFRIKQAIPMGFKINVHCVVDEKKLYKFLNSEYNKARSAAPHLVNEIDRIDEKFISKMCSRIGMDLGIWYKSLGSCGSGNHFVEIDVNNDENCYYLTLHFGSRNFGVKVCNYWAKIASNPKVDKAALRAEVERIKSECTDRHLLKDLIAKAKEDAKSKNPNGFLSGENMRGYISDMIIAQAYAKFNHMTVADRIFDILHKFGNITCEESIYTTHNYIDVTREHPMVRKGAISAYEGEIVIIPMNMAYGTFICRGKGNADWNYSAPHGAGRIMSRSAAKSKISMEDFKKSMEGVYSTTVCKETLDESPQSYKDPEEIRRLIEPTVDIIKRIKPIINIKAADGEDAPWKK